MAVLKTEIEFSMLHDACSQKRFLLAFPPLPRDVHKGTGPKFPPFQFKKCLINEHFFEGFLKVT